MKILGHTSLDMTKEYVQLQTNDLSEAHARFSPLAKR
jgi:site-specific recombinase XerD